jgi:hypothetical protein
VVGAPSARVGVGPIAFPKALVESGVFVGGDPLEVPETGTTIVPKGRDEDGLPFTMSWLRHHDRYEDGRLEDADRPYWPAEAVQS